jgi:hypothetical protein
MGCTIGSLDNAPIATSLRAPSPRVIAIQAVHKVVIACSSSRGVPNVVAEREYLLLIIITYAMYDVSDWINT